jgi:hypothetical protein
MSTHKRFAHELIANTAKDMAACFYEEAAHDNDFYRFYPNQKMFIAREWKRFVEHARKQLAEMLGRSDIPEHQKEFIHDALIKHASLPGNTPVRQARQLVGLPEPKTLH